MARKSEKCERKFENAHINHIYLGIVSDHHYTHINHIYLGIDVSNHHCTQINHIYLGIVSNHHCTHINHTYLGIVSDHHCTHISHIYLGIRYDLYECNDNDDVLAFKIKRSAISPLASCNGKSLVFHNLARAHSRILLT